MNQVILIVRAGEGKEENLPAAVAMLREKSRVVKVSSVYETASKKRLDQPVLWYTAVLLETMSSPSHIASRIIERIEQTFNEAYLADLTTARVVRLKIALFNKETRDYESGHSRVHRIPDPAILQDFQVAAPVAELAPTMRHPQTGEPLQVIANRLVKAASQGGPPPIWRREDIKL